MILDWKPFDPVAFKFHVAGDVVYGFCPDVKVSGNEDEFTLHLQFTSGWNSKLKHLEGSVVNVECRYGEKDDYKTVFEKRMKVEKHKIVFDKEIPSVFVTFKIVCRKAL